MTKEFVLKCKVVILVTLICMAITYEAFKWFELTLSILSISLVAMAWSISVVIGISEVNNYGGWLQEEDTDEKKRQD